ncbi:L-seryl-tRNA(Sec) selenium transferase [Litchfieldia alkalitelluris]|uniref:L-seryl-tRNA(Sec) selenium transferase n=1 Tax=Litchfieldia alkalitelluris TaxID=304268 RepID=UPI000998DD26|nr:L-seryl-tRNA(Sec) selenium transferase [Litchfieldia alkalitelluris]
MNEYLRLIPPIHEIQKNKRFHEIETTYGLTKEKLTQIVQEVSTSIRAKIKSNTMLEETITKDYLVDMIFHMTEKEASSLVSYYMKKVINATGTVLHTNLGRARLSEKAIQKVVEIAGNYSNLEYNIEKGTRGSRHDIIEGILQKVTGAEAAMVVNNNAAAVYLILRALAKNKEVIVSRGQLVEIGGSFRVSSIMEESDATLVEVGTTNKTHLVDYENAINEETAMIMKVHTSNFKTIGFTKTVPTDELISLQKKYNHVLFYEDLGSGVLYDYRAHRIGDEPVVAEVIKEGADIVSFSGDKLLGGPQAGIIVGKKELIAKLKKHQLARVLRVDKMTLAALEATLQPYLTGGDEIKAIPTVRDILDDKETIRIKAQHFINQLNNKDLSTALLEDVSQVGGGTMPDVTIPTYTVTLTHVSMSAEDMAVTLRTGDVKIIARVKNESVVLDFRTISDEEISDVVDACNRLGVKS